MTWVIQDPVCCTTMFFFVANNRRQKKPNSLKYQAQLTIVCMCNCAFINLIGKPFISGFEEVLAKQTEVKRDDEKIYLEDIECNCFIKKPFESSFTKPK